MGYHWMGSPQYDCDPRPDLIEDSWVWDWLLARLSGEAQALFHGFRCLGFRIRSRGERVVLVPTILPDLGFSSEAEYQEFRARWMVPNRELLLSTLQKAEYAFRSSEKVASRGSE